MMFIRILTIFSIVYFSSQTMHAQTVKGKFTGAKAGSKVYLYRYFGTSFYLFDSTKTDANGQFQFQFKQKPTRGFYQIGKSTTESAMFILGKENIQITADYQQIKNTIRFNNSVENTLMQMFLSSNQMIAKLQQQAQTLGNDPVAFQKLQIQYDSASRVQADVRMRAAADTGLLFAKILRMFEINEQATADNYFSQKELTDKEYLYGDMMLNKVMLYFQRFGENNPQLWNDLAEKLLAKTSGQKETRLLIAMHIAQIYQQSGQQPYPGAVRILKTEYSDNPIAKAFVASLPPTELQEGDLAPDITLPDVEGEPRSLSSLRGKIVLLDFWASWCGPCRMENPNVVRVYEKYSSKGFEVFSVSLDQNKEAWIGAISRDRLMWQNHVSDLKGWGSEGARLYNVRAIPMTFLLDKNGVIIAKNLRGQALEEKLKELLP